MAGESYDIVVVGGGLVGASLVSALSGHGLRIALIEAVPFKQPGQPSYDDRTLALSLASCRIFQGIGLWPGVRDGVTPIREVHISNRGHFGGVRIRAEEMGEEVLGYVAEGRVIGNAVVERLPQLDDVDLICPGEISALVNGDTCVEIEVDTGCGQRSLTTRLLIGADGANSWVRNKLGLATREHDYEQTAVIANVTPEDDHRNRAFERFTDTGPLALLPHIGRRCGLVWTVKSEQAEALMGLDDERFLEGLQARFGQRLGRFMKLGRRTSYPLRLLHAADQHAGRCLIIGNAAHTIHPISAQGFNLGLRDVAVLAELIVDAWSNSADLQETGLLAEYQHLRQRDQQRMIAYTDGLVRGFSQEFLPARLLRSAGLVAVQLLPGMKRALARRTMGFGGHVPRLARGLPLV